MPLDLTDDIRDAKRFDSQSDAEYAAHVLESEVLWLRAAVTTISIDGQESYVVYVAWPDDTSKYLKSFR